MTTVRALAAKDQEAWNQLYAAYAEFYQVLQTQEMRDRVWSWLHDPAYELKCLVAVNEADVPIGLAHYRPFMRPLSASVGGFLDDLFVAPQARGQQVSKQLIEGVAALGREKAWTVIRWITAEDNYRARRRYDALASKTGWVTYDLKLKV